MKEKGIDDKKESTGIVVKKSEDMSEWYNQVVLKAELADFGVVKGTMVIRPRGYQIWQEIVDYFNNVLKKHGVYNSYFPLFIPESFFKREEEHATGFSPEVAYIANKDEDNNERIALRPTSETIMYDSYSKWIRSYRDLPLKINQWCNIIRWETKSTRLFLRSREFLWQEGHNVFETKDECEQDTINMLKEYKKMVNDLLAIPVIFGTKSNLEKFPGAINTYTIEGFMPDGKALQLGTSHYLGQGFAKVFNIKFIGSDEKEHYPHQNSWGVSTRLIGALILVHSDDKGLVLPPKIAYNKIVIVPIIFEDSKDKVLKKCDEICEELADFNPILDSRTEYSAGYKFNDYELKGIPLRIEIGPKDLEKDQVVIVRRDNSKKESYKISGLKKDVPKILEEMQKNLFEQAKIQLEKNTIEVDNFENFKKALENKKLIFTYLCEKEECELKIKEETGATTRCIPFENNESKGKCVYCQKQAKTRIYFSKNY